MNGRYSLRRVPAVALSVLALAGCSLFGSDPETNQASSATPSDKPLPSVAWKATDSVASGGTLRLGLAGLPANFNPEHESNSDTDLSLLLSPISGSAVRITADGGWKVDANYARSVKIISRSPLKVRVQLNRNAVWQGGAPITAADMIAYVRAHDGSNDDFQVSSTRGFDDITSVVQGADEYEYTVSFDQPLADWPRFVYPALPSAVSSRASSFNDRFTKRLIPSNGPFVVRSVDRKQGRIVMEPNHRWWGEAPKLDRIVWQAVTPDAQLKAVVADELDVVHVLPADRAALADLDSRRVDIQVAAGTEWTQLTLNGGRGPLRDVKVRRAIAQALNRPELADLATTGLEVTPVLQGSFVMVPGQSGYRDGFPETSARGAEKLLDGAGWKVANGSTGVRERKGKPLRLKMPVPAHTGTIGQRAELIAAQLKTVGIEVVLESVPDDRYFTDRILPLDFDLATFSHVGSAFPVVDSEALFFPVDSPRNFTGIDGSGMGPLWDDAVAALSDKDRNRVVQRIDDKLFDDVPIVPLGVVPEVVVVRDDVVNVGASQFQIPDWTQVGFVEPRPNG